MATLLNLGRVVGSKIYTGAADSNAAIKTLLTEKEITPLLYDIFVNTLNGNMYQYLKASETDEEVWELLLNISTGVGIASVTKTGTEGLVDTYTIGLTNGETLTTFTVTNGKDGEDGATPDISVAATTLAAGSAATVTKSGTTAAPTFTFGIPSGIQGIQGEKGEDGKDGEDGKTPTFTIEDGELIATYED